MLKKSEELESFITIEITPLEAYKYASLVAHNGIYPLMHLEIKGDN
jgi:hypothetical protein